MTNNRSDGRRALVTGATRGIGRATALALAASGWDVAVTGRTERRGEGLCMGRAKVLPLSELVIHWPQCDKLQGVWGTGPPELPTRNSEGSIIPNKVG